MDSIPDPDLPPPTIVPENPNPPHTEQLPSSTPRESKSMSWLRRQKRLIVDDLYHYDNIGIKSSAMERAEEFSRNLNPPGLPTFVKSMVRSNVVTGYWLHLPMGFCKARMPHHNTTVILEDEEGGKFEVTYIFDKTAFSAGWKVLVTARKLIEGDVVIFQLVEPSRFKVYIVRGEEKSVTDGMSDLNSGNGLIVPASEMKRKVVQRRPRRRKSKPLRNRLAAAETQFTSAQQNAFMENNKDGNTVSIEGMNSFGNGSADFEEAKSTGNFSIVVNGTAIESEVSETQRTKYYDLCMSHNSYLHGNLLKSISPKLATEMISETVNIADMIKGSGVSTSQEEYLLWDQTLEGFETLGMRVGFLRIRLGRLREITSEFQKYKSAEAQKEATEKEMSAIRNELLQLKELKSKLNAEMEDLKTSVERYRNIFQQEASAAW